MLTLMKTTELTDEQWQRLKILLPPLRKGRGRLGSATERP